MTLMPKMQFFFKTLQKLRLILTGLFKGGIKMYYLKENGKTLHKSGSFERLLNFTTKTKDAEIYFNNNLVWVQNTAKYYGDKAGN